MKIAVLSDTDGRLIGLAPVHDAGGPAGGNAAEPVGRIVAQEGQILHELDVDENILTDPLRISRLHETHRVSEGRLVPFDEE